MLVIYRVGKQLGLRPEGKISWYKIFILVAIFMMASQWIK